MFQLQKCILALLLFFLSFLNVSGAESTGKLDSLLAHFEAQIELNLDSAAFYLKQAKAFSKGSIKNELRLLFAEIQLFDYHADYKTELKLAIKAAALARKLDDDKQIAQAHFRLGYIYDQLSDFNSSLENYLIAESLYSELKDEVQLARVFNNIGIILEINQEYVSAENYFVKSLGLKKKQNNDLLLVSTYNNLGLMCYYQKKYKESEQYYTQAYDLAKPEKTYKIITTLLGLSDVAFKQKDYKKSISLLKKAENLLPKFTNDPLREVYVNMNFGAVYLEMNEDAKAFAYLSKAESQAKTYNAEYEFIEIYNSLYKYYKKNNIPVKAYEAIERSLAVKDSIFNDSRSKQLSNMLSSFEKENAKRTIKELKVENELQKAINKEQTLRLNFILLLMLFLVFVIGGFYFRFRERQKVAGWLETQVIKRTEVISAQNKEKTIMLREIHHRVKNNLQLISSFLSLQRHFLNEKGAELIISETQDRVRCMAIIHEKLYQTTDLSYLDSKSYMEEIAAYVAQSYSIGNKEVSLVTHIDSVPLPIDLLIPCGLILNELVSNCFKHAFSEQLSGNIKVEFVKTSEGYRLSVCDDGKGLPSDFDIESLQSLGMTILTSLVQQLDGELLIENKNGTCIGLQFS